MDPDEVDDYQRQVQSEVRSLLAALPEPGPMPAHLEQRIRASLAAAAETRAGDRELFDELGMVEEETDREPDNLILFSGQRGLTAGSAAPQTSGGPRDVVRRRWPVLVAAAAAVVAVGGIGTAGLAHLRSGSDGLAALPGSSSGAAPGPTGRVHVQVSTTAYTKGSLPASARTLLSAPGPEASSGDAPSVGPLATEAGVDACLAALDLSNAGAVSVDLATYEGQPAAIIVATRADQTVAYAVGRECTIGDPQVVQDAVPVP